jgi:predicted nucleic acid-binding Zn ribbon protein
MPTYTYQTPSGRRFDVRQGMSDAPLTHDPETGEPVERVISGGTALLTSKESAKIGQPPVGGCGSSCGCGH